VNKKFKRLLLLTIAALVLGIAGSKVLSVLTPHTDADIEKLVAARMDPSKLPQFSNVRRDEVDEHDWCGEVTGKDSFGAPVDHQRFSVIVSALTSPLIEFDTPNNRSFIDKLCGGTPSHASHWISVAKSEDGSEEFADLANIQVADKVRVARIRSVYPPHSVLKDQNEPSTWWTSAETTRGFNCEENTARRESLTVYFSDGTDSSIPAKNLPTPWKTVGRDSMIWQEITFICAWKAS
jgi:hypothetical protein